jgi:hypothetical protein
MTRQRNTPANTYPAVPDSVLPHYTPSELKAILETRLTDYHAGNADPRPATEYTARLRAK